MELGFKITLVFCVLFVCFLGMGVCCGGREEEVGERGVSGRKVQSSLFDLKFYLFIFLTWKLIRGEPHPENRVVVVFSHQVMSNSFGSPWTVALQEAEVASSKSQNPQARIRAQAVKLSGNLDILTGVSQVKFYFGAL